MVVVALILGVLYFVDSKSGGTVIGPIFDSVFNFSKKEIVDYSGEECDWRPSRPLEDYGGCYMILGYYFDGENCVSIGGCENLGDRMPFGVSENDKCVDLCENSGCGIDDIYLPVCGVNGRTYDNSDSAKCDGVEVGYEGVCGSGGSGGSICGDGVCDVQESINGDCSSDCDEEIKCLKCGNECVNYSEGDDSALFYCEDTTENFYCKYVRRECKKVISGGSICGDGVCTSEESELVEVCFDTDPPKGCEFVPRCSEDC